MTVKDLQLYKENNKYYLSALLDHEDKRGIYEVSMPKIRLPIYSDCAINAESNNYFGTPHYTVTVNFGFGELDVESLDENNNFYTLTCLEEKVYEMTLAEIEKELGYKIKLKEENRPC